MVFIAIGLWKYYLLQSQLVIFPVMYNFFVLLEFLIAFAFHFAMSSIAVELWTNMSK